jgi:hypothetical protein
LAFGSWQRAIQITFEAINYFKLKNFQLQNFITSQDVHLLFGSFLHLTKW